jgi:hypothetical protein
VRTKDALLHRGRALCGADELAQGHVGEERHHEVTRMVHASMALRGRPV